jgi:hypothetical protein
MAIKFCRRLSPDAATAREWASSAISETWVDISRVLERRAMPVRESEFVVWVRSHVILRCRDQARAAWTWKHRTASYLEEDKDAEDADAEDIPLRRPASAPAAHENWFVRTASARQGVAGVLRQLVELRETLRPHSVLADMVDQMQAYLRMKLSETIPTSTRAEAMTLDELVAIADLDEIEVSREELYRFVQERLNIDGKVFYSRMSQLHNQYRHFSTRRHSR